MSKSALEVLEVYTRSIWTPSLFAKVPLLVQSEMRINHLKVTHDRFALVLVTWLQSGTPRTQKGKVLLAPIRTRVSDWHDRHGATWFFGARPRTGVLRARGPATLRHAHRVLRVQDFRIHTWEKNAGNLMDCQTECTVFLLDTFVLGRLYCCLR